MRLPYCQFGDRNNRTHLGVQGNNVDHVPSSDRSFRRCRAANHLRVAERAHHYRGRRSHAPTSRRYSPAAPVSRPVSAGSESHSSTRCAQQSVPESLDVYPVNYEASSDFSDRIQFAQSVVDGIKDAGSHIEATAANCPKTRIVLGGYSQGAAVAGFVTSASIPAGDTGRVCAVFCPSRCRRR